MSLTQITTHGPDALNRLLEQYKNKPLLAAVLNAFTAQVQDLETALYTVLNGRDVFDATGAQLDAIGAVVGLKRQPAWADPEYQALIFAEVGLNVSQGNPERVISVFAAVTQATHVDLQEYFPAAVGLYANAQVDSSLVNLLWQFCNNVLPAAVRCDHFGYYDVANPFAFAGGSGAGFDDGTGTVGGKLAALYAPTVPEFAFDGDNNNPFVSGFGDVTDPVVGGQIVSL